jgi:Peptidoglycan-binding protein, CsiV
MKKNTRLFCILAFLYSLHVSLYAAEVPVDGEQAHEQTYKVEIIIFQRTDLNILTEESWLSYPPLPLFKNAVDMNMLDPLSEKELSLTKAAQRIDSNTNYTVLLHQGWIQPILKPKNAPSVHIYAQPLMDKTRPWLDNSSYINELLFNRWRINGSLTISQLNYFNVNADIILTIPFSELNKFKNLGHTIAPDRRVLNFHLQQNRRIRSDQLYYFDHPLFGILIEISENDIDNMSSSNESNHSTSI